jgi:Helix-hairpin-helix motif
VGIAIAAVVIVIGLKACSTPTPPTTAAPAATEVAAPSGKPQININSAILSELDKLEGQLGIPALSNKIQASRPYGNANELVTKKVMTPAQFDQIKDQVTTAEIALTGEAKDVDYLHKLALMKGHMLVAGELLALNQPALAEPHLGHPVEEIYIDLADQLSERQVPEFKNELTKVQDLVRFKPGSSQIKADYNQAMAAIDKAIAALPATQRQAPPFMLKVINSVLDTAGSEYRAAIANGKVKEAIEYQDSRGFVSYAQDTLYRSIAAKLTSQNAAVQQKLTATLSALRKAWPTPIPPASPVLTVEQVVAKVKLIEQTAAPLTQAPA